MDRVFSSAKLLKLLGLIKEMIPSDRIVVLLRDGRNQAIFKECLPNEHGENCDISSSIIQKAVDEKNPIIIEKIEGEQSSVDDETVCIKSVLCLPLFFHSNQTGVIYLDRKANSGLFTEENLELLIAFSEPVNQILGNELGSRKMLNRNASPSNPIFIGKSDAFRKTLGLIDRVKNSLAPVFIYGESGTGKELVARTIHQTGPRNKGKFVPLNCGAIPEHLLESELFGYMKGSFTGAFKDKPGLIEEAEGGTFFLDEVGDLSLYLQAKLLRVLQEREIRRIGENRSRFVNIRFISATNKNIEEEIKKECFREDLYYRLKIITIELAPLREKKGDILFLINHFLEKYCREMKRGIVYFSPCALELLLDYSWPGNVRELQNEIQRCLILCEDTHLIKENCLSLKIYPHRERSPVPSYDFFRAKSDFEKRFLNQALARFNYNRVKTAEEIGLSRQGLFKLIKKHNIVVPSRKKCEIQNRV